MVMNVIKIPHYRLLLAFALCTIFIALGNTPVFGQGDTLSTRLKKGEAVMQMVTAQYGDDVNTIKKPKHAGKKTTKGGNAINSPSAYRISGQDKYLKTKEAGRKYTEFEVFDLGGLDNSQVTLGLLTNTLDRSTRYDDQGALDDKIHMSTGYLGTLEKNSVKLFKKGNSNLLVSAIRFRDKYFLIIGENDYRFVDGRKLVGDQKVVDALMKGKPITEITFFFELQEAGIVDKNMSARQFMKLTPAEKQKMLNGAQGDVNVVASAETLQAK